VRNIIGGLAVGLLLALGFSAPATAAANDPITFSFTDGCGYVTTTA
jgi:hypothetical protein